MDSGAPSKSTKRRILTLEMHPIGLGTLGSKQPKSLVEGTNQPPSELASIPAALHGAPEISTAELQDQGIPSSGFEGGFGWDDGFNDSAFPDVLDQEMPPIPNTTPSATERRVNGISEDTQDDARLSRPAPVTQ